MTFTTKLDALMRERGIKNASQLSEASGIPYTTIRNWYSRGYEGMSVSTLRQLCEFFGVTMESMIYDDLPIAKKGQSWHNRPLGPEDEAVLDCFWNGDADSHHIIFGLAHGDYSDKQKRAMACLNDPFATLQKLTEGEPQTDASFLSDESA